MYFKLSMKEIAYNVGNPADSVGKDEGSFREHVAASHTVHRDGDDIGNIKHHDRARDDGVECTTYVNFVTRQTIREAYLDDPRKIRPKMITRKSVMYKAFRGTFSLGWTLEKKPDTGRPPSLLVVRNSFMKLYHY